jgi:regulator of ribonuclease activity B
MPDIDPIDQQVLDSLQDAGADLSKPTNFIFFVIFDGPDRYASAAERLSEAGWSCAAVPAGEGEDGVTMFADRDEVPSPENVVRMRAEIEAVAEEFGGTYDDWEAAVTT